MHISVRYKPHLGAAIRLNLYLARKSALISAAWGVLVIVWGVKVWPGAAWLLYGLGVGGIIRIPLAVWVGAYRHREFLREEVEVTLTGEGIDRRTKTHTLRVTWDMVEQVDELKNQWIFVTKRPTRRIALGKERLSQEQQAELEAFIESRHLNGQVREMTHVQEASYALAYGIARSDLKPEVQAEYDRLAAERRPA